MHARGALRERSKQENAKRMKYMVLCINNIISRTLALQLLENLFVDHSKTSKTLGMPPVPKFDIARSSRYFLHVVLYLSRYEKIVDENDHSSNKILNRNIHNAPSWESARLRSTSALYLEVTRCTWSHVSCIFGLSCIIEAVDIIRSLFTTKPLSRPPRYKALFVGLEPSYRI